MHGRYPLRIREANVDKPVAKIEGLKSETEGLAAQDQALLTRAYQHHIIKDATDPHCSFVINPKTTLYEHDPKTVVEKDDITNLYVMPIYIITQVIHGF